MSPLSRETWSVRLEPGQVRHRWVRRGWRASAPGPWQAQPVVDGQDPVGASLSVLRELLAAPRPRRFEAEVVLSNRFLRFAGVPQASRLPGAAARQAAARQALRRLYGDDADDWRVTVDAHAPGLALACGVDAALVDGLERLLREAGATRVSTRPYLAQALNAARLAATAATGWVVVSEPQRHVVATVAADGLVAVRQARLPGGLADGLPALLAQSRLLDACEPQRREVLVLHEGEAPALPAALEGELVCRTWRMAETH